MSGGLRWVPRASPLVGRGSGGWWVVRERRSSGVAPAGCRVPCLSRRSPVRVGAGTTAARWSGAAGRRRGGRGWEGAGSGVGEQRPGIEQYPLPRSCQAGGCKKFRPPRKAPCFPALSRGAGIGSPPSLPRLDGWNGVCGKSPPAGMPGGGTGDAECRPRAGRARRARRAPRGPGGLFTGFSRAFPRCPRTPCTPRRAPEKREPRPR